MALEHIQRRATRIKKRREELDLTQEELADRMHEIWAERNPDKPRDRTVGQMISDWERAVNSPSDPKLELLAAALDWTMADLHADPGDADGKTPDLFGQDGDSDEPPWVQEFREQVLWLREAVEQIVEFLDVRSAQQAEDDELPPQIEGEPASAPRRVANGNRD